MSIVAIFGFIVFLLLVMVSITYAMWMASRSKLEREAQRLHQLMQTHYEQMQIILDELEPMMAHDHVFFETLRMYVEENYNTIPQLGVTDGEEVTEFYNFLDHLDLDAQAHLKGFKLPLLRKVQEIKLSLLRAKDNYIYANNEYNSMTGTFPLKMFKLIEKST